MGTFGTWLRRADAWNGNLGGKHGERGLEKGEALQGVMGDHYATCGARKVAAVEECRKLPKSEHGRGPYWPLIHI